MKLKELRSVLEYTGFKQKRKLNSDPGTTQSMLWTGKLSYLTRCSQQPAQDGIAISDEKCEAKYEGTC